jgi:hypothetical protein
MFVFQDRVTTGEAGSGSRVTVIYLFTKSSGVARDVKLNTGEWVSLVPSILLT